MVQGDTVVCDNMQGSSLAHGGGQWSFGAFPPGRPPDRKPRAHPCFEVTQDRRVVG
jgi:hypothetical protein